MIFVTGGTGFIGAYIIKTLIENGEHVRAIRRSSPTPFFIDSAIMNNVEWVNADILDPTGIRDYMQGAKAVIHAAAKLSFYKKEKQEMFKTNISGTANIVDSCIELNIPRLIHISSVASLGRVQHGGKIDENKKWTDNKSNTPYAISKYYAEMEVWRGMAEGLNAVILNPGTVVGYGNWHQSSCAIFKSIYNEFPWYTEGINGFVDVEDIAEASFQMLHSDISGERFILTGDNWSFKKLFDTIADNLGKPRPNKKAGPLAGELAWRVEKLKSIFFNTRPLLTKETAKIAQTATYFDNSKIRKFLPGFEFTSLDDSISSASKKYLEALESGILKN